VIEAFGGRVPVLDGGPCIAGVESTILRIDGDRIVQLRAGALPRVEIEALTGRPVLDPAEGGPIVAPGMLSSHYAPRARIRLGATAPGAGEAYLAYGEAPAGFAGPMLNLSPARDPREAARNLFAMLRELDASGAEIIAVAPIPSAGLGEAINDRLARAAAPR
jgi:L-threonylcarbamoyladenylate synthase